MNYYYYLYILMLYPCYIRNRITNWLGRYRDPLSWSIGGLFKMMILTLFSDFPYVCSDSCREQLDNCYNVILWLRCVIYIRNRIQNRFSSYGDCMSWSMIFVELCLHYKGSVYILHIYIKFATNESNNLIVVYILLFNMLIYNFQTKSKLVR